MIELIPVLIVDPRKQSIQRLAIENSDVFRSMHELLDLSLIDENGSPSLEVSISLIGNTPPLSFALQISLSLWAWILTMEAILACLLDF